MKKLNRLLVYVVIFLVLVALNYGFDLLLPLLKQSPLWNVVKIAAGAVLLLLASLLYLPENNKRQNTPLEKILLLVGFFLLGAGILLNGASFWWNVVETLSFLLMGAGMVSWVASFFLILRAENKQKKLSLHQQ